MGRPYTLLLDAMRPDNAYVDFATTKGYVFLVSKTHRVRWDWEPGGGANLGAPETIDGVPTLAFRIPAEWTRDSDNFPVTEATEYELTFHVGELSGTSGFGAEVGTITVHPLADGQPVS
jgi:hypothetical protein